MRRDLPRQLPPKSAETLAMLRMRYRNSRIPARVISAIDGRCLNGLADRGILRRDNCGAWRVSRTKKITKIRI